MTQAGQYSSRVLYSLGRACNSVSLSTDWLAKSHSLSLTSQKLPQISFGFRVSSTSLQSVSLYLYLSPSSSLSLTFYPSLCPSVSAYHLFIKKKTVIVYPAFQLAAIVHHHPFPGVQFSLKSISTLPLSVSLSFCVCSVTEGGRVSHTHTQKGGPYPELRRRPLALFALCAPSGHRVSPSLPLTKTVSQSVSLFPSPIFGGPETRQDVGIAEKLRRLSHAT